VNVTHVLRTFEAADVAAWRGLPAELSLDDVGAALRLEGGAVGDGYLGDERHAAHWIAAESATYEGGFFVWHDGGQVLVFEGRDPVDSSGDPLVAPDLGEPEAMLDSVLDRLFLPGGEPVYATRGLALRVNPENGLLLGVLGFAPTTADAYRARLRPELPPRRPLPDPAGQGNAW